ncbi:hypothetical protein [Mycobacterium sp.]|uniref:hypothetical protein n=1 Tax=Mycobacterium sp. TaxID=1785 RepID=UPI00283F73AF|nr:hypothetical protein [Mycobacterium sp.]HKI40346.1 hypothetical protein [Mycobacterium sp.]
MTDRAIAAQLNRAADFDDRAAVGFAFHQAAACLGASDDEGVAAGQGSTPMSRYCENCQAVLSPSNGGTICRARPP